MNHAESILLSVRPYASMYIYSLNAAHISSTNAESISPARKRLRAVSSSAAVEKSAYTPMFIMLTAQSSPKPCTAYCEYVSPSGSPFSPVR